jgi:hypothetical protein
MYGLRHTKQLYLMSAYEYIMNQYTVNWLAEQIRESRIAYKRLIRELHQEINS